MIGQIKVRGIVAATLDDDGVWQPGDLPGAEGEAVLLMLRNRYDPDRDAKMGDHHLPFGWATLGRAATDLGGEVVGRGELEPLPPGAVS